MGKEDKLANTALVPYVHTNIWSQAVRNSNTIAHKKSDIAPYYIVWQIGENVSKLNSVLIPINGRCECQVRKDWDSQCEHELSVNSSFNSKHHHTRLLNSII